MSHPRPAAIVDMDGTLIDVRPVLHYLNEPGSDWDAFHAASRFCPPVPWVVQTVRQAAADGLDILIVTARDVRHERPTRDILARLDIPCRGLFMRPWGDRRPHTAVKADLHRAIIAAGWAPTIAFDDRPDIVNLWASLGINARLVEDATGPLPHTTRAA